MTTLKSDRTEPVKRAQDEPNEARDAPSAGAGADRKRGFLRPLDDMVERLASDQERGPER